MPADTIADQLAITDLVNRSVAGVLRQDPDMWGATWAADASWKIDLFDQPVIGRAAIVDVFSGIISRFAFVAMSNFVTDIVIAGDRATGKAWSQEFMFPKAGGQKLLCGCFHDDYVCIDGRWLFQSRRYETLHRATISEPPVTSETPAMTSPATGPADPLARQAEVLGQGPRIAPLAPEERTPEQQALIDRLKPPPQVAAMKGAGDTQWAEILAHHPALFMSHMGLAQQFMASPTLSSRTRELAVLRLGWISGAPFEWGGHVTIAKACGVSAQEIERVIAGPDAAGWTAHEAALLRATDELHADSMITDPTWAALAEGLDAAQLIEFIMLIGQYKTVAFYQNALRFSLPEGNDGLLAR